jgi:hypothetical protein
MSTVAPGGEALRLIHQLLDAWLMADRRVRLRGAGRRLSTGLSAENAWHQTTTRPGWKVRLTWSPSQLKLRINQPVPPRARDSSGIILHLLGRRVGLSMSAPVMSGETRCLIHLQIRHQSRVEP